VTSPTRSSPARSATTPATGSVGTSSASRPVVVSPSGEPWIKWGWQIDWRTRIVRPVSRASVPTSPSTPTSARLASSSSRCNANVCSNSSLFSDTLRYNRALRIAIDACAASVVRTVPCSAAKSAGCRLPT
jgi:hypothetical protein